MPKQYRPLDSQLIQCGAQQTCLDFDGDVAIMIWPVAVSMTGPIEGEGLITRSGKRAVQSPPVMTRAGIAVKQNDGPAGALDHKVEIRSFDVDEFRLSLSMIMRDAGRDVFLLQSASNAHACWIFRGEDSPPRRREREGGAEKSEPRMLADENRLDKEVHAKALEAKRKGTEIWGATSCSQV